MKENIDFKLFTTSWHFVAEFATPPVLDKKDMPTTNGEKLRVGEKITWMGDERTSAGFVALDLKNGYEFEYIGMLDAELWDGKEYRPETMVFFDVFKNGIKANTPIQGKTLFDAGEERCAYPAYILGVLEDEVNLYFHTRANSGRMTCTETIVKNTAAETAEALRADSTENLIKG